MRTDETNNYHDVDRQYAMTHCLLFDRGQHHEKGLYKASLSGKTWSCRPLVVSSHYDKLTAQVGRFSLLIKMNIRC